jgi:1,4-alpha-glucan branching enzyme
MPVLGVVLKLMRERHAAPSMKGRTLALVVMFCSLSLLSHCTHPFLATEESEQSVSVIFNYRNADARRVCVAGSFNGWSTRSHCMSRTGPVWTLSTLLPPGRHQYVFVVDERDWRADPGNPLSEDSGFGTRNSVLIIE